ncbi:hypothetical protein BDV97DRAFT_352114 [Delphinella strobiligena]|nr:hypothetical protein BDV97DRAFT_352114 [Delphinella strobiligena]
MAASKGKSLAQTRAEDRIAALRNAAARRESAQLRADGVSDVFQEMLSEATASAGPDNKEERPAKKRRLEDPNQNMRHVGSSSVNQNKSEIEDQQIPQQTAIDSGDSEDEDEIDWEEVGFDQVAPSAAPPKQAADEIADVSIDVAPKKTPQKVAALKRKPITTVEKLLRMAVHKAHLLFLIFHVHVRNSWCNLDAVQSKLKPVLSLKTIGLLHPREDLIQFSRSENFINGLRLAVDTWQARFRVIDSGMRQPRWADTPDEIKQQINSISEGIRSVDKAHFIKYASSLRGSQDVGNQLFCALLRSVGVEARLVCSLQPLPFGAAGAKSGTPLKPTIYADSRSDGATSAEEGSATGSASETSITPKGRRRRIGQPNFAIGGSSKPPPGTKAPPKKAPNTVRKLEYPIFWVEVFNSAYQRWVPVDPIVTGTINKPAKLEPPASYDHNTLSYVIAFDGDGYARDVTRRYSKAYNAKTRKLRVESTETGDRWWRKALKPFRRRDHLDRDQVEDAELAKKEAQEGMPNNVQDFKNHPYYALERQLKRHEVIFPKREVGKINAGKSSSSNVESVYRRNDIQLVRSADKWYRVGREIKPGEQALKRVPTRRGLRAQQEDPDEEAPMTALYAFSQTSLYTPPPVTNGRIPKNAYGNLDVYVPSMVPPGAVHVRHNLAAKAAKVLGIDYADAVTGFKFKGRIGEAIKAGVVVAAENSDAVETTIEGFQTAAQEEEDAKRSLECLRLWRRFLTGLRIGVRIGLYESSGGGSGPSGGKAEILKKELDKEEDQQDRVVDAGGFILDAAEETVPTVSRFASAAKPMRLLARAQQQAEAEEYEENVTAQDIGEQAPRLRRPRNPTIEEGEDEQAEDIDERAPRLRRRRNMTMEESESNLSSEEEYIPETVRPPPTRRKRGRGESPPPEETETTSTTTTRRSTRQTRSRPILEESSSDEEDDPNPISSSPQPSAPDSGGGFIPDIAGEEMADSRGGFIPEQEQEQDFSGGFIPEDNAMIVTSTTANPPRYDQSGGFTQDEIMETDSPAREAADDEDAVEEKDGNSGLDAHMVSDEKAEDKMKEDDMGQDDDDEGSLISHDPDDEDAEPEWLNSD